mmetsp:Transcript_5106/g.14316  ORF Transcript_5106/g.14316 Transcript_5106/m.14316 type:complete len:216 (-) Transcript_5106:103-750(-)
MASSFSTTWSCVSTNESVGGSGPRPSSSGASSQRMYRTSPYLAGSSLSTFCETQSPALLRSTWSDSSSMAASSLASHRARSSNFMMMHACTADTVYCRSCAPKWRVRSAIPSWGHQCSERGALSALYPAAYVSYCCWMRSGSTGSSPWNLGQNSAEMISASKFSSSPCVCGSALMLVSVRRESVTSFSITSQSCMAFSGKRSLSSWKVRLSSVVS